MWGDTMTSIDTLLEKNVADMGYMPARLARIGRSLKGSLTAYAATAALAVTGIVCTGCDGAEDWSNKANKIAPTLVGGSKKHGGPDLGPTRARRAWQELHVNGSIIGNTPPARGFKGYKDKQEYKNMPLLTVRMAARIQGFPDWWQFCGKKTPAYRQVGNAFPPPVAEALGRAIVKALDLAERSNSSGN